jgi:DNA repair exonuclease SbcCD ATPase subunit
MKLHRITITNFRSFKGEQTFYFPGKPGLYFMQGVNDAEPRLGANGAGKSTIWEALLWVCFGKTSRGLKAGDVCNWDADKGTAASLDFYFENDPGVLWTVKRTWKPNSWVLAHVADRVTDEEVIDLTKDKENYFSDWLALEFAPFLHCLLMAQSQPMFLDLKHDQQASLFSEVLSLDHWLDYSAKASKQASAQDMETRRLERRLSEITGRIDGQQDFSGSVEQWEAERKRKLKGIEDEYQSVVARYTQAKAKLPGMEKADQETQSKYVQLKEECQQLDDKQVRPALKFYEEARRERDRAADRLDDAKRQLERTKNQQACPTCQRDFDAKDHRKHVEQEKAEVGALSYAFERRDEDCQAAVKAWVKAAAQLDDKFHFLDEIKEKADSNSQALRTLKQNIQLMERELDAMEDDDERIRAEVNPFKDVQAKAREEGQRLRAEREETQRLLDSSSEQYQLFSYWVRGFKELRLQLIAEALTELEIEVNSCVTALGLVDWELRFQVDRETKGGSIQRGFSVQVVSPASEKPTPWEAWSGGESQRLRLAATMGLSNLIRSRLGVDVDLEVWDEPSAALSPQGVQDLLEALEHRAHQEQRVIWVVDHTAHAFGGFAGGATITKTRKGSFISQY